MENLNVGKVIISKQGENSDNYQKFKSIVEKNNIKVVVVGASITGLARIQIENNIYFDILWPYNEKFINENTLNNNSIVCKLHYKNFSMLFTGDIEKIAEEEILKQYAKKLQILNSTVLKTAHHGSKTSSTQEFINRVNPKIALIGVGKDNKFGHPSEDVVKQLELLRS